MVKKIYYIIAVIARKFLVTCRLNSFLAMGSSAFFSTATLFFLLVTFPASFQEEVMTYSKIQVFWREASTPKKLLFDRNPIPIQAGNDLSCSLCKTVMELVDQAITDGANEQAVRNLMK